MVRGDSKASGGGNLRGMDFSVGGFVKILVSVGRMGESLLHPSIKRKPWMFDRVLDTPLALVV